VNLIDLEGKTRSDANALPVSSMVNGVYWLGDTFLTGFAVAGSLAWVNSVDGRGMGGTFKAGSPETS
jgi:hypothetical protein